MAQKPSVTQQYQKGKGGSAVVRAHQTGKTGRDALVQAVQTGTASPAQIRAYQKGGSYFFEEK